MSEAFDPYHKWLGIAPKDQPPHHYKLLGLEAFEADLQVIESAADRQLGFLRKYQSGEHATACQKLLNEVSRARLCLLKPASKAEYDADLRARLERPTATVGSPTDSHSATQLKNKLLIPAIAGGIAIVLAIIAVFALRGGGKADQKVPDSNGASKVAKASGVVPANAEKVTGQNLKVDKPNLKDKADGQIDILPMLASEHIIAGRWKIEPERLESLDAEQFARITLPVDVPPEYTIHVEGTRLEHPGASLKSFGTGLIGGGRDFLFIMETHEPKGTSGLQNIDGRIWDQNETSLPGSFITTESPFKFDIIVRSNHVEARMDGRTIVDWHGEFSRLKQDAGWRSPEPQRPFLVAASKYVFTKITLGPPLPVRKLAGTDLKPDESVELLKYVDPKRDVWDGAWLKDRLRMKSDPGDHAARFAVPFVTPEEYELTIEMECYLRGQSFYLGLPFQQGYSGMALGTDSGQRSVLIIDGQVYKDAPIIGHRGQEFPTDKNTITAMVRKNHLVVKVGDAVIFDWHGDPRMLMMHPSWATPGKRIAIGSSNAGYQVHSVKIKKLPDSSPFPKPAAPQDGDLLPVVDVYRDTILGAFQKVDGKLVSEGTMSSGIRFPTKLPASYEFRIVAERKTGEHNFSMSLPVGGHSFLVAIDGGNGTIAGVEWVEDRRVHENRTTSRYSGHKLPIGKPGMIMGRVEGKHLTLMVNDEKLLDLELPEQHTDYPWEMRPAWLTPEEQLQLAITTWFTSFVLHDVRFRPLDSQSPAFPAFDLAAITKATPPAANATTPSTIPGTNTTVVSDGLLTTGTTAVPDTAAQVAALKKVRQTLADDFAKAKKDPEKLSLASRLETLADNTRDDMAVKYVSFEEARKLFMEAGDLTKSLALIDEMCIEFKLDQGDLKISTLKGIAPRLKGPLLNRGLAEEALPLVDRFIQVGNYSAAAELAAVAVQAATKAKDKPLQTDAQEARKEAQALAEDYATAQKAQETLKMKPDDPDARLAWGRWLCLSQNNWAEGLKVLQGSGDAALKGLAERDLRGPNEMEMLQLGQDWLEYAKVGKDHSHAEFATRALHWFDKAHEQGTGLLKSRVEIAMEEAVKVRDWNSPLIALLNQIEPKVVQRKFVTAEESNHSGGDAFEEVSAQRGILIGFNCSIGAFEQHTVFRGIQPVYATKLGTKPGAWHGSSDGQLVELRARPGYAVSGLRSQSGGAFDNLQVAFSRITKTGLDPKRSYRSPLINGPSLEIPQTVIPPSSQPSVGIFGHADSHLRGLGLLIAR